MLRAGGHLLQAFLSVHSLGDLHAGIFQYGGHDLHVQLVVLADQYVLPVQNCADRYGSLVLDRCLAGFQMQTDGEYGALLLMALDINAAAHGVHDALDDGKTEAAAGGSGIGRILLCKRFKDVRQELLGNAAALILDREDAVRVFLMAGKRHGIAFAAELDGIGQQIQEHFLQADAVAQNPAPAAAADLVRKPDALLVRHLLDRFHDALHHFRQIHRRIHDGIGAVPRRDTVRVSLTRLLSVSPERRIFCR